MKHFVEPLVLHCPLDCAPMVCMVYVVFGQRTFHGYVLFLFLSFQVSLFMAKFLTNLQNNLAVAWSDGPASNTDGLGTVSYFDIAEEMG